MDKLDLDRRTLLSTDIAFELLDSMDPGNLVSASGLALTIDVAVNSGAAGSSAAGGDGDQQTLEDEPPATSFQNGKVTFERPVLMHKDAAAANYTLTVSVDGVPGVAEYTHDFEFVSESLDHNERQKSDESRRLAGDIKQKKDAVKKLETQLGKKAVEIAKADLHISNTNTQIGSHEAEHRQATATIESLQHITETIHRATQVKYNSRNPVYDALDTSLLTHRGVLGLVVSLGCFEDSKVACAVAQRLRGVLLDIVIDSDVHNEAALWVRTEAERFELRSANRLRDMTKNGRFYQSAFTTEGRSAMGAFEKTPQRTLAIKDNGVLKSTDNIERYGRCLGYAVNLVVFPEALLSRAELFRSRLWYPLLKTTLVFEKNDGMKKWINDHRQRYSNVCISLDGGSVLADGSESITAAPKDPDAIFANAIPGTSGVPLDVRLKERMQATADLDELDQKISDLRDTVQARTTGRLKLQKEQDAEQEQLVKLKDELEGLENQKKIIDTEIAQILEQKQKEGRPSPDAPRRPAVNTRNVRARF